LSGRRLFVSTAWMFSHPARSRSDWRAASTIAATAGYRRHRIRPTCVMRCLLLGRPLPRGD